MPKAFKSSGPCHNYSLCLNFNLLLFVISFRYDFFKSIRSSIHRSLKRRKLMSFFLHPADYPAYNFHPFFLSDSLNFIRLLRVVVTPSVTTFTMLWSIYVFRQIDLNSSEMPSGKSTFERNDRNLWNDRWRNLKKMKKDVSHFLFVIRWWTSK